MFVANNTTCFISLLANDRVNQVWICAKHALLILKYDVTFICVLSCTCKRKAKSEIKRS
jgi:hypothetical protein